MKKMPHPDTVLPAGSWDEIFIILSMSAKLFRTDVTHVKAIPPESSVPPLGELGGEESVLKVNRLILPPQKGSRDQVEMLDEEVLLEETMMKGFIVLGWIHTHPEFDCFLSSIDVHTTLSYQLLLEEAIAIVMAPKDRKRKCGVFRLSTPGGLELVKDCKQRGFHQHGATKTGQDVYEVASHVYINPDMKVVVSDRRAG